LLEDCADRVPDGERQGAETFDLFAAALITQRPIAEVLAVIRQESIAAFAQARTRAFHHLAAIERRRFGSNPEAAAASEMLDRNLFHRSAWKSVLEARVVNDAAASGVYSVMAVERARRDQVRGERRFLAGAKERIA
jgi:hypothetical protein